MSSKFLSMIFAWLQMGVSSVIVPGSIVTVSYGTRKPIALNTQKKDVAMPRAYRGLLKYTYIRTITPSTPAERLTSPCPASCLIQGAA